MNDQNLNAGFDASFYNDASNPLAFVSLDTILQDQLRSAGSRGAASSSSVEDLMFGSGFNAEQLAIGDLAGNDLGRASAAAPVAAKVSIDVAQKQAIAKFGKRFEWEGRTIEILDPGDSRAKQLGNLDAGQIAVIDPQALAGTPWEKTLANSPILITEDFILNPPSQRPKVDPFANLKPAPESDEYGKAVIEWMKDPLNRPSPIRSTYVGAPPEKLEGDRNKPKAIWGESGPGISTIKIGDKTIPYEEYIKNFAPVDKEPSKSVDPEATAFLAAFSAQLSLVGVGNFNSTGTNDLLLRNEQTGEMTVWYMNGTVKVGEAPIMGGVAPTDYAVEGVGDFDGNGRVDIAFRQTTATGNVSIWFLGGSGGNQLVSAQFVNQLMPMQSGWQADAVADFNNDGKADWLWRNQSNGTVVIHYMNGAALLGSSIVVAPNNVAPSSWKIVGSGDINGDAVQDIFWRNSTTGDNVYWLMNSGYQTILGTGALTAVPDLNWKIETVGDINGDNRPDLIWEYPGFVPHAWLSTPSLGNLPSNNNGTYVPGNSTGPGTNNAFAGTFNYHQRFGFGLIDVPAAIANLTGQGVAVELPDTIATNPSTATNNSRQNELVNFPEVWNQFTGQGVTVAVLDNGVALNHPDLDQNVWFNAGEGNASDGIDNDNNGFIDDLRGWNFYNGNNNPFSVGTDDHGTNVAGVIAAEQAVNLGGQVQGGAFNSRVMTLKIGEGQLVNLNMAAQATIYAANNGARVINMSFTALQSNLSQATITNVTNAVNYAISRGAVVVIAAGNNAALDAGQLFPASLATIPGVIVVGAVNSSEFAAGSPLGSNALRVAGFSTAAGSTVRNFVVAPGNNVVTTVRNGTTFTYGYVDGTSFAAPMVAAAVAAIIQAAPTATPAQIVNALTQTADSGGLYLA
jgi:subtilisin family serine protease